MTTTHRAIPLYDKLCREYGLLMRAIKKGILNATHEQWNYWVKVAPSFDYPANQHGVSKFTQDLKGFEFI